MDLIRCLGYILIVYQSIDCADCSLQASSSLSDQIIVGRPLRDDSELEQGRIITIDDYGAPKVSDKASNQSLSRHKSSQLIHEGALAPSTARRKKEAISPSGAPGEADLTASAIGDRSLADNLAMSPQSRTTGSPEAGDRSRDEEDYKLIEKQISRSALYEKRHHRSSSLDETLTEPTIEGE